MNTAIDRELIRSCSERSKGELEVAQRSKELWDTVFSRLTNLEGWRHMVRGELDIVREHLEKLDREIAELQERPPGKLEAVQPGPNKAAERRRELAKKKRDQVLPQ